MAAKRKPDASVAPEGTETVYIHWTTRPDEEYEYQPFIKNVTVTKPAGVPIVKGFPAFTRNFDDPREGLYAVQVSRGQKKLLLTHLKGIATHWYTVVDNLNQAYNECKEMYFQEHPDDKIYLCGFCEKNHNEQKKWGTAKKCWPTALKFLKSAKWFEMGTSDTRQGGYCFSIEKVTIQRPKPPPKPRAKRVRVVTNNCSGENPDKWWVVYFSPDGKKHKDGPFQGQCAAVKHMRTSKASIKMVLQEGTFVMSKKPNVLVENANGAGRFSLLDLNECPPPFARPVN
jgi:hypothetical protein